MKNDLECPGSEACLAPPGTLIINACLLPFDGKGIHPIDRCVPIECPIAFEYNGIGYAVMMGTPINLEDFVIGFTISEGLAAAAEISEPKIFEADGGFVVRCNLPSSALSKVTERARTRVSESGCGICGIDSIAAALAPLPRVVRRPQATTHSVWKSLHLLYDHQAMGRATGASHVAAWCASDGEIICVREDVGRHNALDKLIGALSRTGIEIEGGFVLLSARCSQELVEKTVRAGISMLVTISAPSSLAVNRAAEAGLTLIALARQDNALVINDPFRVFS
jgi:formate dehydrogenase accessory protein FdhD